jgi:hypothetical protein
MGFSIAAIVSTLTGPISDLLSEFIVDKDQRNALAHDLATMSVKQAHAETLAQIDVNREEASHASIFVAGWRPFLGWVGGFSLANNYVLAPYVTAFFSIEIPVMDFSVMMPILLGMLGITAARTFEKVNGVAREVDPKL